MTWFKQKEHWFPEKYTQGAAEPRPERPVEKCYSIAEVAEILSVHPQTVYKYLPILPANGWFKLPGGDIRIKESVVRSLQAGEISCQEV